MLIIGRPNRLRCSLFATDFSSPVALRLTESSVFQVVPKTVPYPCPIPFGIQGYEAVLAQFGTGIWNCLAGTVQPPPLAGVGVGSGVRVTVGSRIGFGVEVAVDSGVGVKVEADVGVSTSTGVGGVTLGSGVGVGIGAAVGAGVGVVSAGVTADAVVGTGVGPGSASKAPLPLIVYGLLTAISCPRSDAASMLSMKWCNSTAV